MHEYQDFTSITSLRKHVHIEHPPTAEESSEGQLITAEMHREMHRSWIPDGHGHPDPNSAPYAVTRAHLEHDHLVPNMALWAPSLWPSLHKRLHENVKAFNPYTDVIAEGNSFKPYTSLAQLGRETPIYDQLVREMPRTIAR